MTSDTDEDATNVVFICGRWLPIGTVARLSWQPHPGFGVVELTYRATRHLKPQGMDGFEFGESDSISKAERYCKKKNRTGIWELHVYGPANVYTLERTGRGWAVTESGHGFA